MQTPDIEQKLLNLINDLDHFRQDRWFSQELNIFKAVRLYRQEIRHSNFLAFLLSPQQNHGEGCFSKN
jgi:PD-(D/E)XK nuclease superfamily